MGKRELLELARQMRRQPTVSEDIAWQALRGRKLCGVKFRRQQVIESFIVDFYAPAHRLVVEIDGDCHFCTEEKDRFREQFLRECGLRIIRFSADELEHNLRDVLHKLKSVLLKQQSSTPRTKPR